MYVILTKERRIKLDILTEYEGSSIKILEQNNEKTLQNYHW